MVRSHFKEKLFRFTRHAAEVGFNVANDCGFLVVVSLFVAFPS